MCFAENNHFLICFSLNKPISDTGWIFLYENTPQCLVILLLLSFEPTFLLILVKDDGNLAGELLLEKKQQQQFGIISRSSYYP